METLKGTYTGECKKGKANGRGKAVGTDTYEGFFKTGLQGDFSQPEAGTFRRRDDPQNACGPANALCACCFAVFHEFTLWIISLY